MSTAIICNSSLRNVILELLEDAKTRALAEGKKLGREEQLEKDENTKQQAYENGWREGHKTGLEEGKEEWEVICKLAYEEGKTNGHLEEREDWVSNHSEGLCASLEVLMP
jgi:flagellar biosynthesis/type III secretory pathway protein FliH